MGCLGAKEGGGSAGSGDSTNYDHLFKLVMVGEVGVGKSSLVCRPPKCAQVFFHGLRFNQVLRYTDDTFLDEEVGTIGADFKVKFIKVDKKNVKSK